MTPQSITDLCSRIESSLHTRGDANPENFSGLLQEARLAYDQLTTADSALRDRLVGNWEWLNYAVNFKQ
jgi:hypothetical protein